MAAALALVAGLVAGVELLTGWGSAPTASAGGAVAVHAVRGHKVKIPAMNEWHAKPVSWPAAGTAQAAITTATVSSRASRLRGGPSAGSGRAGSLPVWIGPPDTKPASTAKRPTTAAYEARSSVSRVAVTMAPHSVAASLGVSGVVFTVARADNAAASGRVHVSLDYSAFADAYGGNYASRLRLVELPACALTTPQLARCRKQTRPTSANDVRTDRVGVDVTLPGAAGSYTSARHLGGSTPAVLTSSVTAPQVVLAAMASASGSGGNYGVEPLSQADYWVTGGSSGAFKYSYPVSVPPVPGGLEPEVSLDYDSQAVDGLSSTTNNEASWVGDGWDYSPGFIEMDYPSCSTDILAPATNDLCEGSGQMSLSLNGVTTPFVTGSGGVYRAEADGGEEGLKTGTGWEIIEPDGTQYYFGMNQLPGYVSGDATTNSIWTAPVYYGCGGQAGFCSEPWRYMLDYVVDPHGNAIAYFYNTQTNYYAEDNGTTGTGAYTQGGTLAKIEYGLRAGSIYGQTPAAQVTFTTSSTVRTDAPTDLTCAQGAACTVTSPTFWTSYALSSITTQSLKNGTLQNVDSWALGDTYPATGDSTTPPSLWLSSITRTGQDGTSVTLPPVSFAGTPMPNVVSTAATRSAGYSLITRFRLTSITNQTGGVSTVAYSPPDPTCAAGNFPQPMENTTACYPDYWSSKAIEDWFNIYRVTSITDRDTTGADPPVVTSYTYSGAAWYHDPAGRSVTVTWDLWRGYQTVTTETGTSPDPVTETVDTYFQGMNDDFAGFPVQLTSTRGDKLYDLDQYEGMLFEEIVYNGAGTGTEVTDTVHLPYTSTATATNKTLGESSYEVGDSTVDSYTTLAVGGTREATETYTYNTYGEVLTDSKVPDTSNAAEDTCTTTVYAPNTTTWLLNLPSTVEVTDLPCTTTATMASQVVSDTKYTYDGGAVAPTAGNVTTTQVATAVTAGLGLTFTYTTEQTATYDEYGRVLTSADADNRTTTTAYTPTTGAESTSVQVTDPQGLVTTTTYDPARDLPLTVTDPGGYQTTDAYDALGRVTGVWTAGNPTSGPAVDKYTYAVSNTVPSVTTEQTEEPGGGYLTSETLYDSLGQTRETQDATASGGSDVADTTYNSDGWRSVVTDPYYISAAPSGTLVSAAAGSVPSETGYVYDGDGRVIKDVSYALGTETWETDNTYGGNYVTVVPPTGGTSETTLTDGRGLTTAIYQYHTGVPASPSDPAADYDQTKYTYTAAQQLTSITDAAGNGWSYTYDLLGDQLTATDPDAGKTTNSYDAAGQLMSATDARNKTISYTYDSDGRKTAEYDTTGGAAETTADEIASWTYDTLVKGQLTSSTAYSGGSAYTEQVTGYNSYELPSGTSTVIPSTQGALSALAGTYSQQLTYAPGGQETSYTDSPAGGLPAETVTTGYDSAGKPNGLTGTSSYVTSLTYTNLGQPLQYKMGTSGEPAYITDTYDPQTGNVTEQNTQTGSANTSIDDLHYTYDHVGNVTSEADTPAGNTAATDVQCFQYDYLGRMVQSWAQGTTGCAATPSASAEGGAAPYWKSFSYSTIGNMTGITSTTPAGAVTTTADTYPAAGAAQPHGLTTQKVTTSAGSTTTSYTYDTDGHLSTANSSAQNESLTWNDAGQLTQAAITPSGGSAHNTSYLYDADSNLLITTDPGTATLYLGDEELSDATATGTVTGTRYYDLGGVAVAARTGASTLAYLAGDAEGTDSVAISSTNLAVTHRYYDPYGNPRGTAPSSWPEGEKGYIGGADDTATGLTNLGVREYQPGTGSFISPDPLLTPYNPQDLNAYAYAADNPSTNSDPSGALMITGGSAGCVGSAQAVVACNSKAQAENKPTGSIQTPSHSGCPPTELTCTVPVPLTNAGRSSYQKNGWVKPAPVEKTTTISKVTASKPRISCGGGALGNFKGLASDCQRAQQAADTPGTSGVCYNELLGMEPEGSISICLVLSQDSSGHSQFGLTVSPGGGGGLPTASWNISYMISNATSVNQLRGPFIQTGGSADVLASAGGDYAVGYDSSGKKITVKSGGAGGGVALFGWELHVLGTNTWVLRFRG